MKPFKGIAVNGCKCMLIQLTGTFCLGPIKHVKHAKLFWLRYLPDGRQIVLIVFPVNCTFHLTYNKLIKSTKHSIIILSGQATFLEKKIQLDGSILQSIHVL